MTRARPRPAGERGAHVSAGQSGEGPASVVDVVDVEPLRDRARGGGRRDDRAAGLRDRADDLPLQRAVAPRCRPRPRRTRQLVAVAADHVEDHAAVVAGIGRDHLHFLDADVAANLDLQLHGARRGSLERHGAHGVAVAARRALVLVRGAGRLPSDASSMYVSCRLVPPFVITSRSAPLRVGLLRIAMSLGASLPSALTLRFASQAGAIRDLESLSEGSGDRTPRRCRPRAASTEREHQDSPTRALRHVNPPVVAYDERALGRWRSAMSRKSPRLAQDFC